ncbi:cardiolipin synthase [Betaproteobacteria bacterium GR16-43]|nr:cardiolipin synthase [Betaproteobacteria bacterium GR16-43]
MEWVWEFTRAHALQVVVAAYVFWVIGAVWTLLLQRRTAASTLSWIFAFAALPFISGLYYLVFGPRRLHRRRARYGVVRRAIAGQIQEYIRSSAGKAKPKLSAEADAMAMVVSRLGQGDPTFATSVKLLDTGDNYLSALERSMRAAKHHIHCEYYIWEPDKVGTRFRDLLAELAKGGVKVRIVIDAMGSRAANDKFWLPLTDAGGEVRHFNALKLSLGNLNFANFRTHRKIVVIDGSVAFLGGKNLHDPVSATASGKGAWRDMHTRIEGEPVRRLQRLFVENWIYAGGQFVLDLENVKQYFPQASNGDGGRAVQILASGPDDERYSIHAFFLAAISSARHRVWITTPYFIPDEPLESVLKIAVLRGVDVQLIVPHVGDSKIVTAASRTYCDAMGEGGVRVFEYGPPMLHAKTMIVDDTMGMVGTANLDNRSFRLNFEVAAAFYDKEVVEQLAKTFAEDRAIARHHKRRRGRRLSALLESLARLASPVL